jgi:hypothetical protein
MLFVFVSFLAFSCYITTDAFKSAPPMAISRVWHPKASKVDNSQSVSSLIETASRQLTESFWRTDQQTMRSMDKILELYREERIDASCFHGVDGYHVVLLD